MLNRHETSMPRLLACIFLGLLALRSVGCQRGRPLPPSVAIEGAVTHNGKSVPDGQLMMYPFDQPGGAAVGAEIKDGRYQAPVVPKGKYRIVLSSTVAPAQVTSSGDITYQSNALLPPIESLPQTVVEISTASSSLDLDLRKKP